MRIKLLVLYNLLSSVIRFFKFLFVVKTSLFERLVVLLDYLLFKFKEKRDLLLLKKLLIERSEGRIYKSVLDNMWAGLTWFNVKEFLENMGCKSLLFMDYDDDINYDEIYICSEIGKLVKISVKTKVTKHLRISWRSITMDRSENNE